MSVMPDFFSSAAIWTSSSFAMRSNSAIIRSSWAIWRRFSFTWNRFSRTRFSRDFMTRYSGIRTQTSRLAAAPSRGHGHAHFKGPSGNHALKIYAAGNFSFTRIVNHTRQPLRRGKNFGGHQRATRRVLRVPYRSFLMWQGRYGTL